MIAALLLSALLLAQTMPAPGTLSVAATPMQGQPTMGTCGSSPSVSGSDGRGLITVGGGVVTACTMNFSQTYAAAPKCLAVANNTGVTLGVTSITTSALVLGFSLTLGGGLVWYQCWP